MGEGDARKNKTNVAPLLRNTLERHINTQDYAI
jgi:hypothetical protein